MANTNEAPKILKQVTSNLNLKPKVPGSPAVATSGSLYQHPVSKPTNPDTPRQIITGSRDQWDDFDFGCHPHLQKAERLIRRWYNDELEDGGGLLIGGNAGCGKTHLALALAGLLGPFARFCSEIDLFKEIQATFNVGSQQTEATLLRRYRRAKVLVYDDLGAYETNNLQWKRGIYYSLFNERKENGWATIVTTNLRLESIKPDGIEYSPLEEHIGVRAFSRLMGQVGPDYYIDLFEVDDWRLRNL